MRRTKRTTIQWLIDLLILPFRLFYKIFITPLDRVSSRRAQAELCREVEETYASLLRDKGGEVVMAGVAKAGNSFDYTNALVRFPDLEFNILRGRYEFRVDMRQLGTWITVFEDSMPTSSGRKGGDGGLLVESALFLERCWNEIPEASFIELRAMRNRHA